MITETAAAEKPDFDIVPDYATMTSQQMLVETLNVFHGGDVVEIRALDAEGRGKRTDSGYFDDYAKAADVVQNYVRDGRTKGVYFVLNLILPELLARAANRIEEWAKTSTSDNAVTSRRWLYIDCDPKRPAGISSTNDQVQQALQRAAEISEWLRSHGLCEPITAMSGNGAHLHLPVDLLNDKDSESTVKGVLRTLDEKFSDELISIDQTVSNAARICRLYGTIARKGDSTADRPHRMARLLHVPDYVRMKTGDVCDIGALQAVAAMSQEKKKPPAAAVPSTGDLQSRVDVAKYLGDHGIEYTVKESGEFTNYVLKECLFNSDHKSPDSYFTQGSRGGIAYKCSHDTCQGNDWKAVKAIIGKPRADQYDPPLTKKNSKRKRTQPEQTDADDGQQPPDISERSYDATDLNDIGNAEHYSTAYENELRYCAAWKKWLVWDGCRWKIDNEERPLKLAKELVHTMFNDAMEIRGGEIFKHVCESATVSRLRAMIALAGPELPIRVEDLDRDSWALNCKNGTVDLTTGKLRPHDRADGITKLCPTEFQPDAESPVWTQFLRDVFADDFELITFVQRLFGQFLTGDVSEQKLALFFGTGANGKSTLLNGFMDTIGTDYTMQCMPDFLMEKQGESHPTEKASLFGKRFVSCVETEASRKLAESTVKMLTGGEKIMARRMREDFWEFSPTHKLVLCTNHRPIIKGTDHGIWRRLLLVPFLQRFDGDRQNKKLPAQLKAERSGILAWAVRGCLEWHLIGLNPPDSVTIATADYRNSEDIFGRFLADCCVSSKAFAVRFSELYQRLEQWADDAGEFLPSKRAVGTWLDDNGFEKYSAHGRCYRGLMLRSNSDAENTFRERR